MNIQYLQDGFGKVTGVFIPLEEWNIIKSKFESNLEITDQEISDARKKMLDKRLEEFSKNPENVRDFDEFMEELENES